MQHLVLKLCSFLLTVLTSIFICIIVVLIFIPVMFITLCIVIILFGIIIIMLPFYSFAECYKEIQRRINSYVFSQKKIKWFYSRVRMWKAISTTDCNEYVYQNSYFTDSLIMSKNNKWNKSCKYIDEIKDKVSPCDQFFHAHKLHIKNKIIFSYITKEKSNEKE